MAKQLLGKEVTDALNAKLIERANALKEKGVVPTLGIVRVGENPSDLSYEKGATKRAELIGINVQKFVLPEDASKEDLLKLIDEINANDAIHGVLMFRPLPKHLKADQNEICNRLDPKKDVDCMTDLSNAGVFEGRSDLGFAPCTPAACMEILDYYGIDCKGKNAVVIGRSLVVGKPAAMMLMGKNATVTVCHTKTVNTAEICRKADILVSAAGVLNSLTKDYVRPGQVVIDVSINWDENKPNARGGLGAIAGDAVYAEVEPIVEAITPVLDPDLRNSLIEMLTIQLADNQKACRVDAKLQNIFKKRTPGTPAIRAQYTLYNWLCSNNTQQPKDQPAMPQ